MKLICPKCSSKVDIKRKSKYNIFQCSCCNHEFRGIEAQVSVGSYLFNKFFGFQDAFVGIDETWCPYCRGALFGIPSVCKHCGEDLPLTTVEEEQEEEKRENKIQKQLEKIRKENYEEHLKNVKESEEKVKRYEELKQKVSLKIDLKEKSKEKSKENLDQLLDQIIKENNISNKAKLYAALSFKDNLNEKMLIRIKYWFEENKNQINQEIYDIFMQNIKPLLMQEQA